MYQNQELSFDPAHPLQVLKQGTFEQWLTVGDRRRRFLVHIPKACRESACGIFILPPDGWSADDAFERTGWKQLAETAPEKPVLFFLEPEGGRWASGEPYGCADGDVAYVDALFRQLSERRLFNIHEASAFLFGCGAGGTVAQMAAMWNPAAYAGLCAIDSAVPEVYSRAAAQAPCRELGGFTDAECRLGIQKGDIPLPVWVIGSREPDAAAVSHWRRSCRADVAEHSDSDTIRWRRCVPLPHPLNEEIEAHTVWESRIPDAAEQAGERLLHRIWTGFLSRFRRWLGDPGGNLRLSHAPAAIPGMEYHFEEVDGWLREWYTYVPESVRSHPETPAPLVLACHGYTCNGALYLGNSGWERIAREKGFIAVFPTAGYGRMFTENAYCSSDNLLLPAWNIFHRESQPEEFPFFRALIERTAREHPVDRSRVFATGHSLGSLMVQMLGLAMPETFAAIAPCSGILFDGLEQEPLSLPEVAARPDIPLPVWMFGGSEETFLVPDRPADGNRTAYTLNAWLRLNHMEPVQGDRWADGWRARDERWSDLIYWADGVPMVGFSRVEAMPHATTIEMSRRIWDEFFSRLSRVDGRIVYRKGEFEA